jgi:inner membrane protein
VDSVTHILTGAAISYGWFRKPDATARGVVATGIAAALFPDIDVILLRWGYEPYLLYHRGITHSLPLLPVWAALLGGLAWLLTGRQRFGFWWLLCAANIAAHVLLDVVTSYGTMIWAPLSDQRVGWGWVFILDPFVWALLSLAIWSAIRLRQPRWTRIWLGIFWLYLAGCGVSHGIALHRARSASPDADRIAAYPRALNPFAWTILSQTGRTVTWQSANRSESFTSYSDDRLTPQAEKTRAVEIFRWFAEFPVVERVDQGDTVKLRYRDLRFRTPRPVGGVSQGTFVMAEVTFDVQGNLIRSEILHKR